jgi:hypothetical protein
VFKITICLCFISTLLAHNSQHQEIIERLIVGQEALYETRRITQEEYKEALQYLKEFSKTTQGLLSLLKIFTPTEEGETSELLEDDILAQINKALEKHNQKVLEDLDSQNPVETIYNRYRVFKKDSDKSPFL